MAGAYERRFAALSLVHMETGRLTDRSRGWTVKLFQHRPLLYYRYLEYRMCETPPAQGWGLIGTLPSPWTALQDPLVMLIAEVQTSCKGKSNASELVKCPPWLRVASFMFLLVCLLSRLSHSCYRLQLPPRSYKHPFELLLEGLAFTSFNSRNNASLLRLSLPDSLRLGDRQS